MIIFTILIFFINLLQLDMWWPVAEMALCLWLHQPTRALGQDGHDTNDGDGNHVIRIKKTSTFCRSTNRTTWLQINLIPEWTLLWYR